MPIVLGRDEFSGAVLDMPDDELQRLFLTRALAGPLQGETAKQRIAGWRAELKQVRRKRGLDGKTKKGKADVD